MITLTSKCPIPQIEFRLEKQKKTEILHGLIDFTILNLNIGSQRRTNALTVYFLFFVFYFKLLKIGIEVET